VAGTRACARHWRGLELMASLGRPPEFTAEPSLLASFQADRFLLVATIVASVGVLVPLFLTPFVPLQDLPNHVALANLLTHLGDEGTVSSFHFIPQPHPVPYWVGYVIILIGAKIASPLFGAKLFVAVGLLAVPFGMMRLLRSLHRSPRLGLLAFALSWDYNMSWGFVAFNLGTGLSLVYIAWVLDNLKESCRRWSDLAKALALGVLIAFTHAHAAAMVAIVLGALSLFELPRWRHALRLVFFSLVPFVGLLPWMLMGLFAKAGAMPAPLQGGAVGDWPGPGQRLGRLFEYTLDFVYGPVPETVMAIVFVVLLATPLALLVSSRRTGKGQHRAWVLYGLAWLLYLALPASLNWPFFQLFVHERHATFILLMGLTLPSCELAGRFAWRLAPGLFAVALAVGVNIWLCNSFAKHSAPFLEIIDAVPRESRVLPVLLETSVPESRRTPLNQFSAYLIAEKGGYSPYLFDTPNLMVRYDAERHLPHPDWSEPNEVSFERHMPHYDYLLVQGKDSDPIHQQQAGVFRTPNLELREIKAAGVWRLYEIQPASKQFQNDDP